MRIGSAEQIRKALLACAVEEPGKRYHCETDCYLHPKSRDGRLSTGRTCFEHLALDAVEELTRLEELVYKAAGDLEEIVVVAKTTGETETMCSKCRLDRKCDRELCVFEWRG